MPSRRHMNSYMKQRRAELKEKGICVDCQNTPAKKDHVCCEFCLAQRREREKSRVTGPLLPFPEFRRGVRSKPSFTPL